MVRFSPHARRWLLAAVILAVVALSRLGDLQSPAADGEASGAERIEQAWQERSSGFMVEISGVVERTLADDDEGSRHQRFIVRLETGRTVLVAHNIDLSRRVPLARGDDVTVRGQYEWNERGGVLHWTHADPAGERRDTGWIRHQGRRYE